MELRVRSFLPSTTGVSKVARYMICAQHGMKQHVFKLCAHAQSHSPLCHTVMNQSFLDLWCNKVTMATAECKAFCMLQFVKHESVVSVQRAFRRQFSSDPPSPNSIRRWYQQFQTTGCLCKGKGAGRPRVSEESVERVRQSFFRSTKKSVWFICKRANTAWSNVLLDLYHKPNLFILQFQKENKYLNFPTLDIDLTLWRLTTYI